MRRPGEARGSRSALLGLVALTGLAAAAGGCKSTASCNSGTVLVSIDFDTATRAADMLDVQVSIDGGAAKSSSIAHKPGDAEGSVEVDFPNGYPDGKRLDVTIVARSGQTVLGSKTATISAVPSGCGTLAITFTGTGSDGGAGAGGTGRGGMGGATGGTGGATGGAGGSIGGSGGSAGGGGAGGATGGSGGAGGAVGGAGGAVGGTGGAKGGAGGSGGAVGGTGGVAGGRGGSGGTGGTGGAPACTNGTTRSCATDGKLGSCAAGTETCTNGAWGACSIVPAAADTCVQGNDDNCNGTKNDGCQCINSVTTKACGYCNNGTQTCTDGKTNTYGACSGATGQDFTAVTLQNSWTGGPFATAAPAAAMDCTGTVMLKGGMAGGNVGTVAFTLPAGLRPTANVWLGTDATDAGKGRLLIASDGSVTVYQNTGSDAMTFTSLEGMSFVAAPTGSTALTLVNSWGTYGGTRAPAALSSGGIVHLLGAMSGGTTGQAFTLPTALIPPVTTYVAVDMFGAAPGRLYIPTTGVVIAAPASGTLSDATSFTSLDGAWYALSSTGYTALTLANGWVTYGGTRAPAVSKGGGIVRFQGAMSTSGTSTVPFTLPSGFAPAANVYVPIGLCNAAKGRLDITPGGGVSIETFGPFTDATCFTSLEGIFFAL